MQDIYLFDVAVVHVFNNRIRKSIILDWCLYLCCNLKRYLKCVSFTYQQPPSLGSSVLLLQELLWRSKFSYKAQWLRHLTARIQLLERIKKHLRRAHCYLALWYTQLWHCTNFKVFLWKVAWEQKEKQEVKFNRKLVSNKTIRKAFWNVPEILWVRAIKLAFSTQLYTGR